jgi:hypothetical protein
MGGPGHRPPRERLSMVRPVAMSYGGRENPSRPESPHRPVIAVNASFNEHTPACRTHPFLVLYLLFCSPRLSPIYGPLFRILPSPPPIQSNQRHPSRMNSQLQLSHHHIFSILSPSSDLWLCACTTSIPQYSLELWPLVCITGVAHNTYIHIRSCSLTRLREPPAAHGLGLLARSLLCIHT